MSNFAYYGFTKEKYDTSKKFRDISNRNNVAMISCVTGVAEIILGIVARFFPVAGRYSGCVMIFGILTLLVFGMTRQRFWHVQTELIVYFLMSLAYSFGIIISIPSKDEKAILFLVIIVLLPVLFVDNAVRMTGYMLAVCILYCLIAYRVKEPEVAQMDLYNVICYGSIAAVTQYFVNKKVLSGFISQAENEKMIEAYETAQQKLKKQAHTDLMTGLYNRTYFTEELPQFMKNAVKESDTVYLVMMDLDKFKMINDVMGHQVGDEVIIRVARVLQLHLDKMEMASRLGGDEYIFALAGCFHEETLDQVVNDILSEIRRIKIRKDWYVSCSIGITSIQTKDNTFDDLYRMTDSVLYEAKQNGGNQIVYHECK